MREEDYVAFKKLICWFFSARPLGEVHDDLVVSARLGPRWDASITHIVIRDEDLYSYAKRLVGFVDEGVLTYTTPKRFEKVVSLSVHPYKALHNDDEPLFNVKDVRNGITYRVELASLDLCLLLLFRLALKQQVDEAHYRSIRPLKMRIQRILVERNHRNDDQAEQAPSWEELLRKSIRVYSIVVESEKERKERTLESLADSFAFTTMYRTRRFVREYLSLEDALGIESDGRRHGTKGGVVDTPPAKTYSKDVVDYYSMGLSMDDPYIKYISFYHVLEFYFDAVFREEMARKLEELVTSPDFSYTDSRKLYGVVKAIDKEMRSSRDNGLGNEQQELQYVLAKYVKVDSLRARLDEIDDSAGGYYSDTRCPFSRQSTMVDWSSPDKVMKALVKRVYQTRNALIHSKDLDDENKYRYRPYKDEAKLRKEVPLIQALAEQVIIGAGKTLKL